MDPVFIGVGELVCNAFSIGANCYNPAFNKAFGLMLLSMAGIVILGTKMLRAR